MTQLRAVIAFLVLAASAPHTAGAIDPAPGFASSTHKLQLSTKEFQTPAGLRGRVNFWKAVFSKYDRNQIAIHHREFPQVQFDVLDLRAEAALMNSNAFDKLKKRRVEARIKEITSILKFLGDGNAPRNDFETEIAKQMAKLPGGLEAYRRTVKDDLVRSQTGIREKWVAAIERSGRYLPYIERVFTQEYQIPKELSRLPFVESSFDYTAYSSVGAAGIWQFMPRTAKQFMVVNHTVDERRDPITATQSAARYLISAYQRLNSWPLAVTAYNHGTGGVAKKIRQYGTDDIVRLIEHPKERPFGFASTNFYPSLLAAIECYEDRAQLFPEAKPEPALRVASVRLAHPLSVSYAMRRLGVSKEELRKTNYALSESVWSGRAKIPAGYVLRVPEQYGPLLTVLRVPEQKVPESAPPASSIYGGAVYKVRKGDTLSGIAKKFGVSVQTIKNNNGLKSSLVQVGRTLVIKKQAESPARQASSAAPKGKALFYKVKKGDNLSKLAKRYGTTVAAIKKENGLTSSSLKIGQGIRIPSKR